MMPPYLNIMKICQVARMSHFWNSGNIWHLMIIGVTFIPWIESITSLCRRSGRHEIKEFSLTFDGEAIVTHQHLLQDILNVQPSNHLSVLWLLGNMRVETYQGVPVNTKAPDKASPPGLLTSLIEPRLTGSKWHTKKELTWENYMKQDIIQDWQRNVHNLSTWITRRVLIKIHGR